jgi:sugar/nucleoside kinase (ribokinase family)
MKPDKEFQEIIDSGCESIYFNGFALAIGPGDVMIALQKNGKTCLTLNTSYTVAKTLQAALDETIKHLESKTGNTIMTTDQTSEKLHQNEDDKS